MRPTSTAILAAKAFRGFMVAAYAILWVGGVVTNSLHGGPPADMAWAGAAFLGLAALLILAATRPRDLAAPILAAFVGFLFEVVGVKTGAIFGGYRYSTVLGPMLWGVPLSMLAAWLVLSCYVMELARRWRLPTPARVLAAAAWLTAIDLVIDPVAANALGFWTWDSAGRYYGIPARNFAGWFGVGALIFGCLAGREFRNPVARRVGISIVAFFAAVAFAHRLVVPGIVGFAIIAIDIALCGRGEARSLRH